MLDRNWPKVCAALLCIVLCCLHECMHHQALLCPGQILHQWPRHLANLKGNQCFSDQMWRVRPAKKKNMSWKQLLIGFDKFSTNLPCQQSLTISWPSCSFRPSCCWAWYWSPLPAPAKHPLVLVGKPRGVVRLSSERNLSHDYYNQLTTYQVGCASTQPPEAIPCHRKPNHFLSPTEIFHCYGPIVAQVGLVKTWSKQVTHPALPNMM